MTEPTPKRLLADILLGGSLEEFVTSRRARGVPWRHIAAELYTATDRKLDVTQETLRTWFPGDPSDQRPDPADVDGQPEPNGDTEPEARAS